MEQKKDNRGGRRQGSGRKKLGRDYQICLKLSKQAYDVLKKIKNKSAMVDELIKNYKLCK